MDLFTYLMAKNNQNTQKDLFSYLLGKSGGQSGTYTTYTGTSLNILNTLRGKIKNIELKPSEITQDGTPTPDAPIEVNTVTGNNTITIQGKNLFDKDNTNILNAYIDRTTTTITSINNNRIVWIPCSPNTTYTISRMDGFQPNVAWTEITPAIGVASYGQVKAENNVATITTGATAKYLIVRVYNGNVDTETIETILSSLQIEYGNQATEYEQYNAQNYSINLGSIEYAKIGTAEDKIYRDDNGDWYFEEHIGKKVLNGTENWLYSTLSNDTIASAFVRGLGGKNFSTYMCNKFPYLTVISAYTTVEYCGTNGDAMRLGVFKSRLNTPDLQGLTSWLSQNNIKVYFELATPTTTQITDSTLITQLEALYQNAQSYNGTTNVTQTNTKLPFVLNMDVLINQ